MSDTDLSPEDWQFRIEEVVALLQDYPAVSNAQMIEILWAVGYDRKTAAELVAYVPMAYLRVLMESQKIVFPPTCFFFHRSGEVSEVEVDRQPMFQAATEYAYFDVARGMPSERIQAIILRSCELPAINEGLREGIAPHALELFPAEFDADGSEQPVLEPTD